MRSANLDVLREAASQVGLNAENAHLLRNGSNAIYLLPSAGVVARVGRPGTAENGARQVQIASWLSAGGIEANLPIDGLDLVVVAERPVTWWTPIPAHRHATPAELGAVLRKLHALQVPPTIDLPNLDMIRYVGERITSARSLPASDREWLQGRLIGLDAGLTSTVALRSRHVVHGDAWQGNLVVPDGGQPILLDFDNVSIGHPAWDLIPLAVDHEDFARIDSDAYAAFVTAYGSYDVRDEPWFRTLADLQELRWTAFAAGKAATSPEAAAEASHRLACLRGEIPRPWKWSAL
ncbi:aminoglycoside phosphotransferase family protein [Nocardioides sp. NPDC047086]|uniref:phosphotransferase enzyme family protein n=1 Tax=Nocardioides sp. NPDC047086 TaxID=3154810 RepID=UPI00340F0455